VQVVVYFKVLCQYFSAGREENHKNNSWIGEECEGKRSCSILRYCDQYCSAEGEENDKRKPTDWKECEGKRPWSILKNCDQYFSTGSKENHSQ
jgi:hypothetical protein